MPKPTAATCLGIVAALIVAVTVDSRARDAQETDGPATLGKGSVVERPLGPGEKDVFRLFVAAGNFLQVLVDQHGVDVAATLFAPGGEVLYTSDCPCGPKGTETISFIATVSGNYRLEIAGVPKTVAGRYQLTVSELRPAIDRDADIVAAERSFAEAEQARLVGTATSLHTSALGYEDAARHSHAAGDRRAEADALAHAGYVHKVLGESDTALDFYRRALPIWEELADPLELASLLNNLGILYSTMGEAQNALDSFRRALPFWQAAGDIGGRAITLSAIGVESASLGDRQIALDYFTQALQLRRQAKDRGGEGNTLHNMARVHAALGDSHKAIELLNQALPLRTAAGDRRGQAETLTSLGAVYASMQQASRALELYDQALPLQKATGDLRGQAFTLHNMGAAYAQDGDRSRAVEHYRAALDLERSLRQPRSEADTLLGLARVHRDEGELTLARQEVEASLEISETLRGQVAGPDLRSAFLASVEDRYHFYIDLLMRIHRQRADPQLVATALEASERARARSLQELLAEAHADIRQGVDPDLLVQERAAEQQLSTKAAAQTTLLAGKHTDAQAAATAKEIEDLTTRYRDVRDRIRATSPRYAELTQLHRVSAADIQAQLDAKTVLLEFALGDEASYLFAVTPTSIACFPLPTRALVEAMARRVYERWSARGNNGDVSRRASDEIALSNMLLGPVASLLEAAPRVVIVADGALQYIPFTALPAPSAAGARAARLLIADHDVVNLPSASTLTALRAESRTRTDGPKRVAVLADPVFDRADSRVTAEGSRRQRASLQSTTDVVRAASDVGLTGFDRLFSSRREADAIAALSRGRALEAVDFDASRETATRSDLSDFAILHFATHGLLDSQHPELSGLVFSLVDRNGQPRNGFLRAHEIYNLKLNADLVVLSACQTALGKDVRGEGFIGLTRGFMYAGARRVVASLWRVPDRATAELMKQFYTAMLVDGRDPAAALRIAQNAIRQNRQWASPYYWAAFTLQGEWQ